MELLPWWSVGVTFVVAVVMGSYLQYWRWQKKFVAAEVDVTKQIAEKAQQLAIKEIECQTLQQQVRETSEQLAEIRAENISLERDLAIAAEKERHKQQLEQTLAEKKLQIAQLLEQSQQLQTKVAELTANLHHETETNKKKEAWLLEAKQQLKLEFNQLAQQILENKGKALTEQQQATLVQIFNPMQQQLSDFKQRVEKIYGDEQQQRATLKQEIVQLKQLNQRVSEDTIQLARALQGDHRWQGNWGEMVLERLLESSGLQQGREFQTQVNLTDQKGQRWRPDVLIHLPEDKDVVIDAKVSLQAYIRFCQAEEKADREQALKAHISSLKAHVQQLSQRNYARLPGINSLEFVLMFVPIEAAFLKAIEVDDQLIINSSEKNIIIVSPSTLLVTLRTIQHHWKLVDQNQHAQEIAAKAGDLYDQFVRFVESLQLIGDHLSKAQLTYEQAYKRLVSGRGNVIKRVELLRKLGAKATKQIPKTLIIDATDDTNLEQDVTQEVVTAITNPEVDKELEGPVHDRKKCSTIEAEID